MSVSGKFRIHNPLIRSVAKYDGLFTDNTVSFCIDTEIHRPYDLNIGFEFCVGVCFEI